MNNIFKVLTAESLFVKGVQQEEDGSWETSVGWFSDEDLEQIPDDMNVAGVTYDSLHHADLPIEWPDMYWLDDNNKRQRIKRLRYEQDPAFEMEDGSLSRTVTG